MHPLTPRFVLLSALFFAPGCLDTSQPTPAKNPCEPNPCTQANKTTCANDNGQAVCLCSQGTLPRPNGTCEAVTNANCPEHPGDSAEPDDCIARAAPLDATGTRTQGIEPVGDYDFFRIDATARNVYVLTVTPGQGALLPRVDVFDHEGKWIRAKDGNPGVQVGFKARVGAPYTVRVSHSPRDPSPATGPYTLQLAPPVQDDHGDTPQEATGLVPAPAGTSATIHSGRIEYGQDEDYFSFPVVLNATYRIEFDTTRTVPTLAAFIRENVKDPFLTVQNSYVEFRAASSTTVFIDLYSANETPGAYAFRVFEYR
ncbi:hypothetical protein [Cystobacter ferrugineus]|uniref:EGF-like domain-containing protein n=1 Tax=Cystobacter ferrugineus TaxID=83449 RepID=A0A1L9B764_9BACT|nr:hypothetical protein [Cystobacter ferrugineus]OJH38096.1 hypothetical protein BON30_23325 [Cystobacter ferrugineus]